MGVWVNVANDESKVQVDPCSFRPLWDTDTPLKVPNDSDPFDTYQYTKKEFLEHQLSKVTEFGVHKNIIYRHEMLNFEPLTDGSVKFSVRNVKTDEKYTFTAPALHIRTGTLMMPKKIPHKNESL